MTLNSEAVHGEKLATLLTEIYATRTQRILYLSADAGVPYQKIVDVTDVAENLRTADVLPELPP